jgi:imidazolonepropionase-like amidohydrolase
MSGLTELGIGSHSRVTGLDAAASGSLLSAAIDISTAINPQDAPIDVDRAAGITRAVVAPEATKSIFGGQGAVIDLAADDPQIITRARAFQFVELGEKAREAAGGSRPAAYAYLHETFSEASEYEHATERDREWRPILTRDDAAALVPVVNGKQPLLVHVNRASDILQVLSLKKSYPKLRIILLGASEGWRVAREIAAAQVPVIAPVDDLPDSFDSLAATESNVGRMTRAGVTVALSSEGAFLETYLREQAARLVAINKMPGATGLDWGQAFATITSNPAKAMSLDREIGSLLPGRRADVVVWDGDPLEAASAALAVYIDGRAQPLENHLTRLRDRYRDLKPKALPKAYTH